MMRFSAGIWPAPEAITARVEQVAVLEQNIATLLSTAGAAPKISAVGECGLDHHWNPSGVDGRCESDFDQKMFNGEHELFLMQLDIAKRLNLPVIVHSRDAYAVAVPGTILSALTVVLIALGLILLSLQPPVLQAGQGEPNHAIH